MAATQPSPALKISIWILRGVIGLLFLAAAAMKLTSQAQMVAEFQTVGLGQWFRYLTGSLELVGAVALLVPRTSIAGALTLLLVDIGAFLAQIAILHMDWVHTVVIGAVIGLLIYLQRRALRKMQAA
jgi:putative oxidoreductase